MSVIPLLQRFARSRERRSDDEEQNDQRDRKQVEHEAVFFLDADETQKRADSLYLRSPVS